MDMISVGNNATRILGLMRKDQQLGLKPEEKLAALESACGIVRSTIAAESFKLMWPSVLTGGAK